MSRFLRQLLVYVRPYRLRMILGVLAGVGYGLAGGVLTLALKVVVDVVFPTGAGAFAAELARAPDWVQRVVEPVRNWLPNAAPGTLGLLAIVSTIPAVMSVRSVFAYLNFYLMNWVAVRAIMDLRQRLFAHLQDLSLSFFHRSSTGELISRISNDTAVLHKTVSNTLPSLVKDPIALVCFMALLVWKQPELTFVSLAVIPVCVVPIAIYSRKVRKSSEALQANFAELTSLMEETFTGIRVVKAYNLEPTMLAKFARNTRKYIAHFMRVVRSLEIPGALTEVAGALGVALVIVYVKLIERLPLTAGDFSQFVAAVFLMYQPIKLVSRLPGQLEQARAASQRVFQLLALEPTVKEPARPVPLRAAGAAITLDGVSFDYGDKHVLEDIQLEIRPGQHVALVGASGAGKTTLANLVLRFYDPSRGAVRVGGVDLRSVSSADLRAQVAVVTQETVLFNDTLRQNIAYGRPGATEAEIVAVARQAHAHEFITAKPQGYDTVIGEKGITLSGGQRQRLAIARALLKNAPILILDEATSALDSESERAVQAALSALMAGRTTISIAHRLSTIQSADAIVVLAGGRVVEQGRHDELLARGGHYRKLYELQFQA
ncbi:MAG: ABC transporter ATP-binding protein [Verrucomicrobia bacterium]|nr:ABC transporter ATP-binding protein [Verrucomicrobiota bacterium]